MSHEKSEYAGNPDSKNESAPIWKESERKADRTKSQAPVEQSVELNAEYIDTHLTTSKGQPLSLDPSSRESLRCIEQEIRGAMHERLVVTEDDLAMLCVAQAKEICTGKQAMSDHAHTLFKRSLSLLNS